MGTLLEDLTTWENEGVMYGRWRSGPAGRWRLNLERGDRFAMVVVEREPFKFDIFNLPTRSKPRPQSWAGYGDAILEMLREASMPAEALEYEMEANPAGGRL